MEDGFGHALNADGRGEGTHGGGEHLVGEVGGEFFEVAQGEAGFGDGRGDGPGVGDVVLLEPGEDGGFAVDGGEGGGVGDGFGFKVVGHLGASALGPGLEVFAYIV